MFWVSWLFTLPTLPIPVVDIPGNKNRPCRCLGTRCFELLASSFPRRSGSSHSLDATMISPELVNADTNRSLHCLQVISGVLWFWIFCSSSTHGFLNSKTAGIQGCLWCSLWLGSSCCEIRVSVVWYSNCELWLVSGCVLNLRSHIWLWKWIKRSSVSSV